MQSGEHSLSHDSPDISRPCTLPISDMLEICKLISRVEPIELLLEKTASTISSTFKVKSLVICTLDDETGMFVPRHVRGFPEDNAAAIRKHTYSMDRKKRDLLKGHRIEPRTYFVRAEDEEAMTNEDLDYVIDQPKVSVPRKSPDQWHPLDYMLFLMVDRLGNWIGWIEIDYMADGRMPSKDAVHRIQLLADLIGIAAENSKIYEEAICAMMESREYLDLIVHDLGNMVDPLIHYLNKMESSGTLDSENNDSLAKALAMSKAAKSLVDDVRKLSEAKSVEVSSLDRYDLRDVLVRCISTLKTEFPARDIVVSLDCPDGECVIGADNLVHDLFLNLLGNAVKHNPSMTAEIDISIENGAGVWTVTIEDHGTGIADEHKSEILSGNGRRMRDGANGNGMGMSIVNLLVERYSGVISVRDRVDGAYSEGACFEIAFPKANGHEPVRRPSGEGARGSGSLSYGS
jgi:signal transduction histidine kinase